MFNSLHSSTNQELFENTSVIMVATAKNTGNFCYAKEATTKSTVFTVSKDEWNTKEDAGKS